MSNKYEATGTIVSIGESKQVSDRFRKREIVLEIPDGRYPQQVLFQLTGDRCELADELSEGQSVTLHFNLRGREWTSPKGEVRYFNTLEVWRLQQGAKQEKGSSWGSPSDDDISF